MAQQLPEKQTSVCANNKKSDMLQVTCGIPQGSVLGPKLFILYINDICNVSKLFNLILFADDTNLFYSGKNLDHLMGTVVKELDALTRWFSINKLSLNVSKTKYMIFGNRKNNTRVKVMIL